MKQSEWLYNKVNRVPSISDEDLAEMVSAIKPVIRSRGSFYQDMTWPDAPDPRHDSFLWHARPVGEEFAFHQLNQCGIITQHKSCVFFKPSLAEVFAWVRVFAGDNWRLFTHFCLESPARIGASSDFSARCTLCGGPRLFQGREISPGCHELVER
jgi:hypothetical protein